MTVANNKTAADKLGVAVHRAEFRSKPSTERNQPQLNADDLSDFRYRLSAIRSVVDGLIERMDALK